MGKTGLKVFDEAPWNALAVAIRHILKDPFISNTIDLEHYNDTPTRVVSAWQEMMSGCLEDPREVLRSGMFPVGDYTQMVCIKGIKVYSLCAHHLLPFIGEAAFAYIPKETVCGISKIPRLIQAFAKRPQIQEKLSDEIVDIFDSEVRPQGCGVFIRAAHFCMACRGVREQDAMTETTALRGSFRHEPNVRQEFLMSIHSR